MAEVTFTPPPVGGNMGDSFEKGLERQQSMMERASRNRQNAQLEQMRELELRQAEAMAPLEQAKIRGDLVKAKTNFDSALKVQDYRSQAYQMWDTAQDDFNFVNSITDDKVRAQASRQWISKYSQLANINDIAPQVKQMRDLAVDNINTSIKLNSLGTAEARSFQALLSTLSPEEQEKARKVKLGLEGRASSAGKKTQTVTLPDGRKAEMVFDPNSGEYSIPQIAPLEAPVSGSKSRPAPTDSNPFVGQSTYDEAAAKASGTKDVEFEAKRRIEKPKRQASLRQAEVLVDRMNEDIDKLIDKVGSGSAGVGGVLLEKFPGSVARDLQVNLDTIKANLGFQTLQAMREASPTGGALGQVSDVENKLLQSTLGSLEIGQSPAQLIENLKKVKRRLTENYGLARSAFDNEFQGMEESQSKPIKSGTSISEMSDVELQERLRKLQGK